MEFSVQNALSVIANVDKKIPLPEFTLKLRELNLPSSNSWKRTKESLADFLSSEMADEHKKAMHALLLWVEGYIRHSAKAVYIFKLNPNVHGDVRAVENAFLGFLADAVRTDYPYQYPALLGSEEVVGFNNSFCLRSVEPSSSFTDLVFSNVKEYQTRDEIHFTADEAKNVQRVAGYSKIIGVKTVLHEHVDVLRFNTQDGVIELYLDVSRPGTAPCNSAEIERRAKEYTSLIDSIVGVGVQNFQLPSSLNLFGVIKKIYDSSEGSVCELGFSLTISGSVKAEKMKLQSSDLRTEPWHAAGMGAVNKEDVDMYRLSVCWGISGSRDKPVLTIPGSYKSLSSLDVSHAIITGCKEKASFDFAFSRLINFAV